MNRTSNNDYTAPTDDDDTFDTECFKEQVEAPQPPPVSKPQEAEYKEDYDDYNDDDFAQDIINNQREVRGNTFLTDDIAGNDNNDIF